MGKEKMLYSSSFDALKKCLVGVQKYIQVMKGAMFGSGVLPLQATLN